MRSLFAAPMRVAIVSPRAFVAPLSPFTRTLYQKTVAPPKHYTKAEVDEKVLDMLFDYAKVAQEKVNLEANLVRDLSIDRLDRFGLYWDLQTEFDFFQLPARTRTRDLQSGREAADLVASILEEEQRLRV
ncbi:hypothetical protein SpCBS45565_g03505 [Spizellomyces sp. 'palustris']|nr:hypothetical protein SpCBS45565_g03505 [Spizellomyces sp. 'palustris']